MAEFSTSDKIRFYDLDKARFLIKDATGLEVAYAYDDLIFAENAVFIFRLSSDNPNAIECFFNVDCYDENRVAMLASLNASAELNQLVLHYGGKFKLIEKTGQDSFDLMFL
jgi:hypothetical protein